jgi:AcrR family transcriptional regulator
MAREYRMRKRADSSRTTRERILRATMELHDEQGVAPTTFADIAKRAGLGQATLYRHFPTTGDLVRACGGHVWQEMRPLTPDAAPVLFAEIWDTQERLVKLVDEIDAFYRRGALRLHLAGRDRELLPELDQFLTAVEAGIKAHVTEALALSNPSHHAVELVAALVSFPVWQRLGQLDVSHRRAKALTLRLIQCGLAA